MYIQLECDGEIYWIKALENPPISDNERQFIGLERVALTVSCVTVPQIPDNVKFLSNFVLLDIF